ncbi:KOW domain-containing RNA-binding protein [[Clostridium] polysaccharolyticum]|jgi:ribosomal protein L14E/L6E/L27E|uniref:Ribosomal protein L14E/L6E/L27E n=1 Tax=[Clostridium] polysaccharolyticum TaxID=29364 RepID=A0A1I0DRJ3_9FIRM|nr:KOW domain-containing RNA-binding protein [[Clostridium] polysaccharolyticum]SET35192.1 hypothetical protein SAMN04487772_11644 [[Clostridium] polysaccharolyticum]
MLEIERGMVVKSLAGHDKTQLYVIISVEGEYVYLADGKCRTMDHLKKKKKKHIQLTSYVDEDIRLGGRIENSSIRKLLKSVAAKQELEIQS